MTQPDPGKPSMRAPIRLVRITEGAEYEIDLKAFPEPRPRFAYVDDVDSQLLPLKGLVLDGTCVIEGKPDFLWLRGTRHCVAMQAEGPIAHFRSLSVGEFCLEIYHLPPVGSPVLLRQDDFCFK